MIRTQQLITKYLGYSGVFHDKFFYSNSNSCIRQIAEDRDILPMLWFHVNIIDHIATKGKIDATK